MTDNDSTKTRNERFTIQGIGIADHERKRLYDLKTVDGFISIRDLLNELNNENEQLKWRRQEDINEIAVIAIKYKAMREDIQNYHQTLDDAIESERTELGRSVLKQFKEAIK